MNSLAIEAVLDKLPVTELDETLSDFVAPLTVLLPDARLREVVPLALRGIITAESPLITDMARSVERPKEDTTTTPWAAAKRIYRFLKRLV